MEWEVIDFSLLFVLSPTRIVDSTTRHYGLDPQSRGRKIKHI